MGDFQSDSEKIYSILDNILENSIIEDYKLYDSNDIKRKLTITPNKNSYSFFTYNNVLLRFTPKKTKKTVEIRYLNNAQLNNILCKFPNSRYKDNSMDLYIYIDIQNIDEINLLKQELLEIHKFFFLNESVDTFGCCSKYVECSDNKKCVCTDLLFRLGCQYKKNLEQGKIFYGKNKTIN